jgi:hypothetical protein
MEKLGQLPIPGTEKDLPAKERDDE